MRWKSKKSIRRVRFRNTKGSETTRGTTRNPSLSENGGTAFGQSITADERGTCWLCRRNGVLNWASRSFRHPDSARQLLSVLFEDVPMRRAEVDVGTQGIDWTRNCCRGAITGSGLAVAFNRVVALPGTGTATGLEGRLPSAASAGADDPDGVADLDVATRHWGDSKYIWTFRGASSACNLN